MEKRDVAIFNVPGGYLHTYIPVENKLIMNLRGKFVEIMRNVNPEYKKM